MILEQTVKMKWNGRNKAYYESKGYIYTKQRDEFEINVTDLMPTSHTKIHLACDECKKEAYIPYRDYYNRTYEEYLCIDCTTRKYGIKHRIEKYIKGQSMSFAQWIINTYGKDFLEKYWDYEKNTEDPWKLTYKSNKAIYIKCEKNANHPSYKTDCYRFSDRGQRCPYCSGRKVFKEESFGQYLLDNFGTNALDLYWAPENTIDPFSLTKASATKVIMICQTNTNHHYSIRCSDFYYGIRCGMCTGKQVPTGESFGNIFPQFVSLWSEKNRKTPYEYTKSSHSYVWWKCENGKHEDYSRTINSSTKYDCRCPECMNEQENSMLQACISGYLNNLGYNVLHEKDCNLYPKNPKTKNNLPYDNEVVELKLIVEAMGKQHYCASNGFNVLHAKCKGISVDEEFAYSQWKDEYKKQYALDNGYYYLAIPYTALDNDKYKELIDNKINEILGTSKESSVKVLPRYRII